MATLLHSESRRLYSWWWDSHKSPQNSKWLQENLTDMDAKVKTMIKLIEEDADSFARRAEMYYKKRPELMKLVEEFYRAYRALAERYNHATVELRQAHRTMAGAFPNQVHYVMDDDSPSSSSCPGTQPHTPYAPGYSSTNGHTLKRNGGYSEETKTEISKRGLKQLHDMLGPGKVPCSSKHTQCEDPFFPLSESQHRTLEAETEVLTLKKAIAEILAEKEAMFLQFQESLEKLSTLDRSPNHAQDDAEGLDEQETRAETEIKLLKENIAKLEAQKDDAHLQHEECLEMISSLEMMLSVAREDAEGLNVRACRAETETQTLREELSKMEAEKEAGLFQYNQYLEKISDMENKISLAEEDARLLKEQAEISKTDVKVLKEAIEKLNEEKEATAVQCKQFLDSIAIMESELFHEKEDAERLRREILTGAAKLNNAEERAVQLEVSNRSLKSEAEHLAQDIAMKDLELSKKKDEMEKLKVSAQDEHTRFVEIEATLQVLQKLHSQSQDEQRSLALLVENGLQVLKDMETSKHGLEEEMERVTQENQSLNELSLSCTNTIQNLQSEIRSLKGIKEKLEDKLSLQAQASNILHQETYKLSEEIKNLSNKYQGLVAQMESMGINPGSLLSSLKGIQDENSRLKEICEKDADERELLYKKLNDIDKLLEENAGLGSSLSEVNCMLRGSREKVKELQESCHDLQGEKFSLVAEKAALLSQLHVITESMQMLLEKNTQIETSLSVSNDELEGLREKSNNLEELSQLLTDEKSNLLNERSVLVSQLENVEQRLRILECRITKFEEKCASLEIEKQNASCQVQELRSCLSMEKQEHANYLKSNEVWLAGLEDHVQLLQEEHRLNKKKFEEQLDNAVKALVEIFILQKFIKDLEEKNSSILIECHKHVEASKLSGKLIKELETENLEQQVEADFMLDEIEKLRMGIHQVLKALQVVPDDTLENWVDHEQIPLSHILVHIEGLKSSLLSSNDDKQQLLIENAVFLTLFEQLKLEGSELLSEKTIVRQEFDDMIEQRAALENDKHKLVEMNRQFKLECSKGEQNETDLKEERERLCLKLVDLEGAYHLLQEEKSKVLTENRYLQKEFSDLKEEMHVLEEENIEVHRENLAISNTSLVFKSFGDEKIAELKSLTEDLNLLHMTNGGLMEEIRELRLRFEMKKEENLCMNESANSFKKKLDNVEELNDTLNNQLSTVKDFLRKKETELNDVVEKLEATKILNMELFEAVEELKKECEKSKRARENTEKQILELSDVNTHQIHEIKHLRAVNGNLGFEVETLSEQIEESRTREEKLNSELQDRCNEFELWEAEAATFYFDMQISSVNEVLLEDKIQELSRVCVSLEEERARKSTELEEVKGRVILLEKETGGLNAELSAYAPAIASLRDDISSLEYCALHRTRLSLSSNQQKKDSTSKAIHSDEMRAQELWEDQFATNGISDLQKMQAKIKAVEKAMVEEMERLPVAKRENSGTNIKPDEAVKETVYLKSDHTTILRKKGESESQIFDKVKLKKSKPVVTEAGNDILMKDIPLDRAPDWPLYGTSRRRNKRPDDLVLELWETVNQDCTIIPKFNVRQNDSLHHRIVEVKKLRSASPKLQVDKELPVDKLEVSTSTSTNPNQESKKIMERLASDAKKMVSLQVTVQDMKKKLQTSKNNKHAEYKTVELHLQQVQEAVMELVGLNDQLTRTIKERPSNFDGKTIHTDSLLEEAQKGSEKIEKLQFEVQNIQQVLLKLENEKKSRVKRIPVSKASVLLRIFLLRGNRTNGKPKKGHFCGCVRPSTN